MEIKEVQQLGQSKQQLKAIQDFFKSTWAQSSATFKNPTKQKLYTIQSQPVFIEHTQNFPHKLLFQTSSLLFQTSDAFFPRFSSLKKKTQKQIVNSNYPSELLQLLLLLLSIQRE
jgi:hypothetical protein